jgi:hypothetical protein
MINTVQRRFAPMVIGIDWNGDRHQIGISDRHRWNTQLGVVSAKTLTATLKTLQEVFAE